MSNVWFAFFRSTQLNLRHAGFVWLLSLGCLVAQAAPVISEFMAENERTLVDQDGEYSDWIEIHNPDSTAVDLQGWYLTDDATRLNRWAFPTVSLAPGSRLVVFASGKNLTAAGKPFHTNFRLDSEGEYLALVRPDAKTVVSEFAPRYPKQYADLSFGLPPESATRDLLVSATLQVRIPTVGKELENNWLLPTFVPNVEWTIGGGLGFGYDTTLGGGDAGNLARNGSATQTTSLDGYLASLALDGNPDTFTHTSSGDNQSAWTLDLGKEYDLASVVLKNRVSCCASRLRDITVVFLAADNTTVRFRSSLLNPENSLDNPASLELDLFELNIGTVTARYVRVERTPDPDLSGSNGQGNADEDNVLSLSEVEVYGSDSVSYADLIRTDLTTPMRGVSATVGARIRFATIAPPPPEPLTLRVRYDDGFVAWLNGTRIAEANAPELLNATARATASRPDDEALQFKTWSVPANLLIAGTNVLALQGLNVAAADEDFLVDAELISDQIVQPTPVYFSKATPAQANSGPWFFGRVNEPSFSARRGFYEQPFQLILTNTTEGATMVYTLDGSEPTQTRGTFYQRPISIQTTTVVRARAIRSEYQSSDVVTHSYLFLKSVIQQPASPAGFPARWASVVADYAMDPIITAAPAYAPRMEESMRSVPSVMFSTDVDNLFGATRGIYANPESGGASWERPVSMEWINPDGTSEFQVGAGLRIQGGYFRNRNVTQKHSLRVVFKDEYGSGRLREDLFGTFGAAREFDTLVLRAGANDGYAWDAAKDTEQFLRDEFGRRLFREMGQVSGHGRFVHVYLNGLYWGMYNLCERPNEDFSATYFGGVPEEWDSVNAGDVKSGSLNAWNQLLQGTRQTMNLTAFQRLQGLSVSGAREPAVPVLLDLPNYIDYMLLNIWGGNWDWPNKNFWFGRRRTPDSTGFKFYLWDFENTMGNDRGRSPLNAVSPRSDVASSWVGEPHARLRSFSEYKLRFSDHVQRHFFGNGPLTPAALATRYRQLAEDAESAVLAETARWGDDNHRPPQDLTDWRRERDWMLNTYLPQRTAVVLAQLRNAGLFPLLAAPTATPSGGSVAANTPVQLRTPARWLYYTLDGSDPRLPGGAPNPAAQKVEFNGDGGAQPIDPVLVTTDAVWKYLDNGTNPGNTWYATDFNDGDWKSGKAELGYGDSDETTAVSFVDTDAATAGSQKNATTYFRSAFNITDPSVFASFNLEVRYDDSVAVYLNGKELHRSDNLPGNAGYQTFATADRGDNSVDSRTGLAVALLKPGVNVIAAEVHQRSANSSDISFALSITGIPKGGATPQDSWNIAPAFSLAAATQLRARSWNGTEWSPVSEAQFTIGTVLPDAANLVISEIAYRPPESTSPAEIAVSTDRDDFEFLELMNIAPKALDLSKVTILGGIQFQFAPNTTLVAGGRILIVKNRAAFEARFGKALNVAGEYAGRLSNTSDRLRLIAANGTVIREVPYRNEPPWPVGVGDTVFSLSLIRPQSNPDPALPASWRPSIQPQGSPGSTDALTLSGRPDADANGNGRPDIVDYALGDSAGLRASLQTNADGTSGLRLELVKARGADQADVLIEVAEAIEGPWNGPSDKLVFVGEFDMGGGRVLWQFESRQPVDSDDATWVRLVIVPRIP